MQHITRDDNQLAHSVNQDKDVKKLQHTNQQTSCETIANWPYRGHVGGNNFFSGGYMRSFADWWESYSTNGENVPVVAMCRSAWDAALDTKVGKITSTNKQSTPCSHCTKFPAGETTLG